MTVANGKAKAQTVRLFFTMFLLLSAISGCATNKSPAAHNKTDTQKKVKHALSIDPTYKTGSRAVDAASNDSQPETELNSAVNMQNLIQEAANMAESSREYRSAATHWAELYEYDPRDKNVVFRLARSLRHIGFLTEAEKVLIDALAYWRDDPLLSLERARVLTAQGQAENAITIIEFLEEEHPNDPGILMIKGIALDRNGDHKAAQMTYDKALVAGGASAQLLNNYALSHAVDGNLAKAEKLLRRAIISRGSTIQTQQNLAMILALGNKTAEAERILLNSSPPKEVARAIEFYSSLSSNLQDIWDTISH
jgi:Flp pilus assembly protein TadD